MVTRTSSEVKPDCRETKNDVSTFFSLSCQLIKIGSFASEPKNVVITPTGIKIVLEETIETFQIEISDINEILYHFGSEFSVVFINCQTSVSEKVRDLQLLQPGEDSGVDSGTGHVLVTICLYEIDHESKILFRHLFSSLVCKELNYFEANNLFLGPSHVELKNDTAVVKKATPKPCNLRKNDKETNRSKNPGTLKTILVYPPPPAPGGIAINTGDYACLEVDQFLNDIIIDFYLNYLMISVLSEYDQSRTFVFSTFFYKRLISPTSYAFESDPNLSPAEKRHRRVKSWTKNVNLFDKDFVVIPINKDLHWFLAIICFPGLKGCVKMSDNSPVESVRKLIVSRAPVKKDTITIHDDEQSQVQDEAESEDEEIILEELLPGETGPNVHSEDAAKKEVRCQSSKVSEKLKQAREPIKQPCILLFDSLLGENRRRVIATLRQYLTVEHKVKMGKEREFTKDTIVGSCPKVPQQNNFTDCGLYLLQYAESFFSSPITDYHIPIQSLEDWFPEEIVNHKRQDICMILHKLMKENNVDFDELDLPQLLFYQSPVENEMLDDDTDESEEGKPDSECEDNFEHDTDFDDELYEHELTKGIGVRLYKRKMDVDDSDDEDGISDVSEDDPLCDDDALCDDNLCGNEGLVEEGEILEDGEVNLQDIDEDGEIPEDGEVWEDEFDEDMFLEDGEICPDGVAHEGGEFEGESLQQGVVYNGGEFENSEECGASRHFTDGIRVHEEEFEDDEEDVDDEDSDDDIEGACNALISGGSETVFDKNNGMVPWKYGKRSNIVLGQQYAARGNIPVQKSNCAYKAWISPKNKRSNASATSSVSYRFSKLSDNFQEIETPQKKVKKKP